MNENLAQSTFFFFPLAGFIISMALGVLFSSNPIKALLYLVMSMIGIGLLFLAQNAVFLGGVQFAVYAGAVMVLFLMVLMLVDLNEPEDKFFKERASIGKFIKVGSVGVLLGLSTGAVSLKTYTNLYQNNENLMGATKDLAINLFKNHMFLFEIMGVLLLVIAVAVVSISRTEKDLK